MVSSRSPGKSVTCNNSTTVDVPNKNDLAVNSTSREESDDNLRNDNEPERSLNIEKSRWNSESGPPSFSMSIDLNHATPGQHDSGSFSGSPDPNIEPCCEYKVTINHEEEERYEAFGSVEGVFDEESPGGSSSAPSPTGPASLRNPRSPNSTIGRHSWLRTSLRRTPSGTSRKRLSSNALASQLYRSSSFNSSGRGSICDTAEDMYSDVSLEDDVLDLNHRNPHSIPIGAQSRKIQKRDASQNCPAEFNCSNYNKGIIEPIDEEVPETSSPKKSVSPSSSTDSGRKHRIKNSSVETSSNKSHKSEETFLNDKKTSSGTYMTDDEKLAFRRV